ncbi:hypothetical protein CH333_09040 [candidate division WOR-3 bacterium JGI_Cruoil_03_44_89]|uniref:Uncharacterized protein n=1 Tax=candidate division WOR-3 bacterium JGI_Cruoil_03_44_89 TaxID=1973748 RepID=A0A235BP44_UNCW3|nr:MAG: hypothetical protein CH333_09040 [candidate division WOR-3 bacterium JGI_Cruoil_03_44_89]
MMRITRYSFILLLFLLASCWVKERHPVSCDIWVAVLPFANNTNDLEIGGVLRTLFTRRLVERGYKIIPRDTVDARLLRIGISDGGQLSAVLPGELSDTLNADLLAYGEVMKADYITLGVYLKKEVELKVSLLAASDTVPFWSDTGRAFKEEINVIKDEKEEKKEKGVWGEVKGCLFGEGKLLGMQLVEKLIANAISHPLYFEAQLAVEDATRGLPSCRQLLR